VTDTGVRVRHATVDDLPAIVALAHALALEDAEGDPFINRSWPVTGGERVFERVLRAEQEAEPWECCWVAVAGEDVVGSLEGGWKERAAWRPVDATEVRSLFVQVPFRRRGIGRRLMQAFLQWSEEHRAQAVELGVFCSNSRAIAFYRSLGFAPTLMTMERVLRPQE
jgi:ribosomal protein S18 acetylase RimI-like enzyme